MAWTSRTKTISLFSSQQSSAQLNPQPNSYGQDVKANVFYAIQNVELLNPSSNSNLDIKKVKSALLNPSSNSNLDIRKVKSVLLADEKTALAQKWLLGVHSKALDCHLHHDNLLFIDHVKYTLTSWYEKLNTMYKQYLHRYKSKSKSVTPRRWNYVINSQLGELLDLFSTWLIHAIEKGYSHGRLLECVYFLDMSSPKLMISDGFDENSRIHHTTNPPVYQVDLDAVRHVLFVIVNCCPVDDLLRVGKYDCGSFKGDVPSYIKSFHVTLSNFRPHPYMNRVVLKPSFIRPVEARLSYFDRLLHYFYENGQERTAFNNLGWSWLPKVQNARSTIRTTYKGNSDVLRFFRNAVQHMIEDLQLVSTSYTRYDILIAFDELLGFTEMIDGNVYAHATKYQFATDADRDNFLEIAGFQPLLLFCFPFWNLLVFHYFFVGDNLLWLHNG